MDDSEDFMSWGETPEIAKMGFEIGNHSWSHPSLAAPKNAARMAGELGLVENGLVRVGVEKPVSFAWCGNHFGPEVLEKLRRVGYRFARRGRTRDLDNRALEAGLAYEAKRSQRTNSACSNSSSTRSSPTRTRPARERPG